MVTRRYKERCAGAACRYVQCRVSDGGSRIAPYRLQEQIVAIQVGELAERLLGVALVGYYNDLIRGDKSRKTMKCALQERLSGTEKIEELLRLIFPAYGPKAAADPAAYNNAVQIVCPLWL